MEQAGHFKMAIDGSSDQDGQGGKSGQQRRIQAPWTHAAAPPFLKENLSNVLISEYKALVDAAKTEKSRTARWQKVRVTAWGSRGLAKSILLPKRA